MMDLEERILKYWTEESKIKEARKTFFEKGIVKRELVEDNLAFSWLRCKYKNLSECTLPLLENAAAERISTRKLSKYKLSLSHVWMGYFDQSGRLKSYLGNAGLCQTFSKLDFSETALGYNAIAVAFEQKEMAMTIGLEHYSDYLIDYVVLGLPSEQEVIGLIFPVQELDELFLKELMKLPFKQIFSSSLETLDLHRNMSSYFFRKDILVFDRCFQQFNKIQKGYGFLRIKSESPYEALLLAKEIHERSSRQSQPFYILNPQRDSQADIEARINQLKEGTLFIEHYRWLNSEDQKRIVQIIDSKLINSKAENSLFSMDIAIILHEVIKENCLANLPDLIPSLQLRLEKVTLVIPSFKEIGQQFKWYLSSEFEKRMAEVWSKDITLSEEALNTLTQYEWPNQYRELLYVIDEVAREILMGEEIPLSALPPYLLRSIDNQSETLSLKAKEKQWIQEILHQTNGNIKKTSEILEITRATLYRKINEYDIKNAFEQE